MEVIDTVDKFRNDIANIFKKLDPYLSDQEKYYELFHEIISEIKKDNDFYENILKIVFLDSYMMRYHYAVEGDLEYVEDLDYFEDNIHDFDDLLINVDDYFLSDMIQETLYFNSLSRNEQRAVLNDCKRKDNYLNSIVPLHIVDKMFYAFPISLTSFLEEDNKDLGVLEYSKEIELLATSDVDNCSKIISDLIDNYRQYLSKKNFYNEIELKINSIINCDFISAVNIVIRDEEIRNELLDKYYVLKRTSKRK